MLARVAENIYWLARYLERAENTARLISVNANLLLDLQRGYELGWLPLIEITGSRLAFDAQKRRSDEREIVQFLLADAENPGIHQRLVECGARERPHAARHPAR